MVGGGGHGWALVGVGGRWWAVLGGAGQWCKVANVGRRWQNAGAGADSNAENMLQEVNAER